MIWGYPYDLGNHHLGVLGAKSIGVSCSTISTFFSASSISRCRRIEGASEPSTLWNPKCTRWMTRFPPLWLSFTYKPYNGLESLEQSCSLCQIHALKLVALVHTDWWPSFFPQDWGNGTLIDECNCDIFEVQKLSYVLTLWYSCGGK